MKSTSPLTETAFKRLLQKERHYWINERSNREEFARGVEWGLILALKIWHQFVTERNNHEKR